MPELSNEGVRKAEAWYTARPDYVERMTTRGSRYLFHILEEVDKRNMPTELALLQARVALLLDRLRLAALAGKLDELQLQQVNASLLQPAAPR